MCGIVAILGRHEVAPLILEALKRLEYRGYDSAGIATLHDGRLARRRAVGKLIALSDLLVQRPDPRPRRHRPHPLGDPRRAHRAQRPPAPGRPASRWCTTASSRTSARCAPSSRPTARSSRPRPTPRPSSSSATASSPRGTPPVEAARATLARLDGAFALCFLFDGEDDLLIAARRGSPLAVGYGDGEIFVGSDALALAPAHQPHRLSRGGRPRGADPRRRRDLRRRRRAGRRARSTTCRSRTSSPRRAPTSTSWPRRCTSSRR